MRRFAIGLVLLALSIPALAQNQDVQGPVVSLLLPPGIASETVQIEYFMIGPFGGYGGFIKAEKNRTTYDLHASVDSRLAKNVKVIAYLPGCRIVTLNIAVSRTTPEQDLQCQPLATVPLRGQILPAAMAQYQAIEVEISYLAVWAHEFYDISDGPLTTIRIGTAVPDKNGQFQFELPDLKRQEDLGLGAFKFIVRQPKTGNIIGLLDADPTASNAYGLEVRASYDPLVRFTPATM